MLQMRRTLDDAVNYALNSSLKKFEAQLAASERDDVARLGLETGLRVKEDRNA